MIKDQMDKKFGAPWHVVVGQAFSYEITYEVSHLTCLDLAINACHGKVSGAVHTGRQCKVSRRMQ